MRLRRVAVIMVAGVALLAGCGSGTSKKTAPTISARHTTPAPPSKRSAKSKSAAHSKVSTGSGAHQPALGWIRRLQRDLTTLHYYAGPVTGIETAATRTSVIRFQRAAHLKPDGLWGPKSQTALDKRLHRKPSTAKLPPALGWVRNLQRDLRTLHLYTGPVTGVFTPATKAAVIHLQKTAHLVPDGEWGAKSQAALDRRLHRHS